MVLTDLPSNNSSSDSKYFDHLNAHGGLDRNGRWEWLLLNLISLNPLKTPLLILNKFRNNKNEEHFDSWIHSYFKSDKSLWVSSILLYLYPNFSICARFNSITLILGKDWISRNFAESLSSVLKFWVFENKLSVVFWESSESKIDKMIFCKSSLSLSSSLIFWCGIRLYSRS